MITELDDIASIMSKESNANIYSNVEIEVSPNEVLDILCNYTQPIPSHTTMN